MFNQFIPYCIAFILSNQIIRFLSFFKSIRWFAFILHIKSSICFCYSNRSLNALLSIVKSFHCFLFFKSINFIAVILQINSYHCCLSSNHFIELLSFFKYIHLTAPVVKIVRSFDCFRSSGLLIPLLSIVQILSSTLQIVSFN